MYPKHVKFLRQEIKEEPETTSFDFLKCLTEKNGLALPNVLSSSTVKGWVSLSHIIFPYFHVFRHLATDHHWKEVRADV